MCPLIPWTAQNAQRFPLSLKPRPVHRGTAPWALPAINPAQLKSGDMFSFPGFRCLITEQIATFISQFLQHNPSVFCFFLTGAGPLCLPLLVVFVLLAFTCTCIHRVMNDRTFRRANWHISVARMVIAWRWIIILQWGVHAQGYMGHLTEKTWPRGARTIWKHTLETLSACRININ